MGKFKNVFVAALLGGLVFHVLATWVAPSGIVWYFAPPAEIGVSCSPAVGWALDRFRMIQLVAFTVGIPIGILVFLALRKKPVLIAPSQKQT